ncbi:MAG: radical SAM protein [Elusimicrobiota bacterium]
MRRDAAAEPVEIALDLTYRCNQSCRFCFLPDNPALKRGRGELTLPRWKALVDAFAGRPRTFLLTGGEPLLRRDLPALIEYIKSRGHRAVLSTNGTLLDEKTAVRLVEAGVDEVAVSLHGDRSIHDHYTRRRGSYDKAIVGLRCMLRARAGTETRAVVRCTIHPGNHRVLHRLARSLVALKPDGISFGHLEYCTRGALTLSAKAVRDCKAGKVSLRPSEGRAKGIDPRVVCEQVARISSLGRRDVAFYPDLDDSGILRWYDPKLPSERRGGCPAQWGSLWLSPAGEVLTCQPLALPMGSGKGAAWRASWEGARYRRFREALRGMGGCLPMCARCGREQGERA